MLNQGPPPPAACRAAPRLRLRQAEGEGAEGPGGRAGRRARSSPASQGRDLPVTAHRRRLRGQREETAAAERPRVQTAEPGKELGARGEGGLLIRGSWGAWATEDTPPPVSRKDACRQTAPPPRHPPKRRGKATCIPETVLQHPGTRTGLLFIGTSNS